MEVARELTPALRPILITDDESDDIFILEHRLRKLAVPNPILTFRDGEELMEFFAPEKSQSDVKPLVLLLDLKMPKVDGYDVLTWLRGKEWLKGLPIAVITSSPRAGDRARAVSAGADEYFEKFPSETELSGVVERASRHPFGTRNA
jgi:CheY-like chemotaxis protein